MTLDIVPGLGVGRLLFGMNEGAAVDLLGPPKEREVIENEATLLYESPPLVLTFAEEDDYRLSIIEIEGTEGFTLCGKPIPSEEGSFVASLEEYGMEFSCQDILDERLYESKDASVSLFFDAESGDFIAISLGPSFDADDQAVWPGVERRPTIEA